MNSLSQMTQPMKTLPSELEAPYEKISQWVTPLGFSVSCDTGDIADFPRGRLGEYDAGSVFEKEILVRISLDNIRRAARKFRIPEKGYLAECALTLFHEVGHALVEQLLDWADSIPEFLPALEASHGDAFFDVFNDDNMDEETLVEDFAHGFQSGRGSVLQRCAEAADVVVQSL